MMLVRPPCFGSSVDKLDKSGRQSARVGGERQADSAGPRGEGNLPGGISEVYGRRLNLRKANCGNRDGRPAAVVAPTAEALAAVRKMRQAVRGAVAITRFELRLELTHEESRGARKRPVAKRRLRTRLASGLVAALQEKGAPPISAKRSQRFLGVGGCESSRAKKGYGEKDSKNRIGFVWLRSGYFRADCVASGRRFGFVSGYARLRFDRRRRGKGRVRSVDSWDSNEETQ